MVLCAAVSLAANVAAQVFNSGSSGNLGDVVLTTNMVWDIPDNGQFHVNTLVVNIGVTLSFRKPTNGLNPPVYILARSNVTIRGTISVDGQNGALGLAASEGGPGGFSGGGAGTPPASSAGDGHGPGRGLFRQGASYGTTGGGAVPPYGNLLVFPLVGGSGGGGSDGNPGVSGGGGGGALLIASDTQVALHGDLTARGGASSGTTSTSSGAGSGGAVRLVAPIIAGNGRMNVSGGFGVTLRRSGEGRARIDCLPQPISISVLGTDTTPPWRVGRNPVIFPPNGQRLEIIHAAGQDIPPGTNSSVLVILPLGSSSNQVLTLKTTNFTGEFDVKVEATPENGKSARQTFRWNVGTNSMATTNVTVTIPGGIPTRITAWAEVLF